MSMNTLIIDTLTPIGIPVAFQHYDGKAETYITFFFYDQRGAFFAENEEQNTEYFLQVDVWSSGNYESIVSEVKTRLKEIGFTRSSEADFYEKEHQIYHKGIRFRLTK